MDLSYASPTESYIYMVFCGKFQANIFASGVTERRSGTKAGRLHPYARYSTLTLTEPHSAGLPPQPEDKTKRGREIKNKKKPTKGHERPFH